MSDGQWLWLTFALLYAVECLRLLPAGAQLLAGGRVGGPLVSVALLGRRLFLLPLNPVRNWVVLSDWRLLPEDKGLRVVGEAADLLREDAVLSWLDLNPSAGDGAEVRLAAGCRLAVVDDCEAGFWRQQLQGWQMADADERRGSWGAWARRSLDADGLGQVLGRQALWGRRLRWLGLLIGGWSFGVVSAVYAFLGEGIWLWGSLVVLWLAMLLQALFFAGACRAGVAGGQRVPWWGVRLVGLLFYPPMAVRAADALRVRDGGVPHVLACRGHIPEEDWLRLAERCWRDLRFVPGWERGVESWAVAELRAFLDEVQVDWRSWDRVAVQCCPRCGAGYSAEVRLCVDCGIFLAAE